MTGVVKYVRSWLTEPNRTGRRRGPGQDGRASADDGDERLGHVGGADGGQDAGDGREEAASQPA